MAFGQSDQKSHALPMDDDDYFFAKHKPQNEKVSDDLLLLLCILLKKVILSTYLQKLRNQTLLWVCQKVQISLSWLEPPLCAELSAIVSQMWATMNRTIWESFPTVL